MSENDWYRNSKWNEEIEASFFTKLKRSRSQRDQYLVIQAGVLAKKYPAISLRLVDFYFDSRKDELYDANALVCRASALLELGDIEGAMKVYRAVLAREEEFPNMLTGTHVVYPYIVAIRHISTEYEHASHVLNTYADRLSFPLDYFRWHAAKALIETDASHAKQALEAAEIKKSGFRFHQDLGLVGKEHENTNNKWGQMKLMDCLV